jgi:hypothetical protein
MAHMLTPEGLGGDDYGFGTADTIAALEILANGGDPYDARATDQRYWLSRDIIDPDLDIAANLYSRRKEHSLALGSLVGRAAIDDAGSVMPFLN